MDKELKSKYSSSIVCFLVGLFLSLEGSGLTQFGKHEENAPGPIIVMAGVVFILAGIMILVGKKEKLNNLLASILIFIMGLIGGWVSLFGNSLNTSSNDMFLSYISGLPLDRIMFGFGSILCFIVSAFAFRSFLKSSSSIKLE